MSTGTLDPRCERTDLPASMCAHCRGLGWEPVADVAGQLGDPGAPGLRTYRDPEESRRGGRGGHTMPANYRSACPGCTETIESGDKIHWKAGRYVCTECAENDEVLS